ncbi:MAG: hypothetical protein KC478_13405 [Bacteriovoracaceae bacterium]|nr:hypothetical protein [Bacteriovoracaceae bacterium]
MNKLFDVFSNLEKWKDFPDYQFERRIDIFFSIYLVDILQEYLKSKGVSELVTDIVIPEFPLKNPRNNTSNKLDYLMLSDKEVYAIEFKTENRSYRKEQDKYLKDMADYNMETIIKNLFEIVKATKSLDKYKNLIRSLSENKLFSKNLFTEIDNISSKSLPIDLKDFNPLPEDKTFLTKEPKVLYLAPEPIEESHFDTIDFSFVKKVISKHDDEFSKRFLALLNTLY